MIPGQGTKVPHAAGKDQKSKNFKMYIKWQGKKKKKTKTERIRRHVLPKLSHSYFGDLHLEEGVCRDPLAFHSFVWLCFEIQVAMD